MRRIVLILSIAVACHCAPGQDQKAKAKPMSDSAMDLSFGVGLTPDTPNLQFSVGFPFRKSLWKPVRR